MYAYQVDAAARKGVRVAWRPPVGATVTRPNGPGIVTRAPYPAAAALSVDWFTGEGQRELARLGVEPVRRDLVEKVSVGSVPSKGKTSEGPNAFGLART